MPCHWTQFYIHIESTMSSYHASYQKTIRQPMMVSIVRVLSIQALLWSGRIWSRFQHKNIQKPLNHRILYRCIITGNVVIFYPFETGATGAYTAYIYMYVCHFTEVCENVIHTFGHKSLRCLCWSWLNCAYVCHQ